MPLPNQYPISPQTPSTWTYAKANPSYILSVCLSQLYYIFFLGIPGFYRNRVRRIFKEVWLSTDEVMEKIIATLAEDQARLEARGKLALSSAAYYVRTEEVGLNNLKVLWESFIEQSIREWKTANLVSILLLSTIVGTLQINEALSDTVVRTAVLMSLICALMSLIYGCVYTVRFSTMKRVHKAFQWAQEGERTGNKIFWNTWVLLAMPVTWLSWSLILYLVGIMAFVWVAELGQSDSLQKFGLASRTAITCVLFVGVVYFVIIMLTLNDYGGKMDGAWREKVRQAAAQRNIVLQHSFDGSIQVIPPTGALDA
ncbi:hypothetical protein C0992_008865 [Termitomyces sp. T32_za158]|nr:hypothetical protein C0992_008865 [Termitomyces sp. T32_za158]